MIPETTTQIVVNDPDFVECLETDSNLKDLWLKNMKGESFTDEELMRVKDCIDKPKERNKLADIAVVIALIAIMVLIIGLLITWVQLSR